MKRILPILALLFISLYTYSQTEANPFSKYGYDVLTATSSHGEFEEFHDTKDIVEIGTLLYNTKTKQIVGFVNEEENSVMPAVPAMSIDPHCERYYWISPYAYCNNNPIRYIDPDGRDWKETKDIQIAENIQRNIARRDRTLEKQENKINANIEKINSNSSLSDSKRESKLAKEQGKLNDVQTQRHILSSLNEGINQLGESSTVYTFNTVSGDDATLSSMENGTIIINNYGTLGNRAHETTHAIQYDNGLISFNPLGTNNAIMRNPMSLEVQAYATEYSITGGKVPHSDRGRPKSVFGITVNWLHGIKSPNSGIYIYTPENYK